MDAGQKNSFIQRKIEYSFTDFRVSTYILSEWVAGNAFKNIELRLGKVLAYLVNCGVLRFKFMGDVCFGVPVDVQKLILDQTCVAYEKIFGSIEFQRKLLE